MMGALDGIKVLDLSRILAGPWCTMTLGDLGAEVWKIEPPKVGDGTRQWSPPEKGGVSTYYLSVNRNKKSVAVDLNRPAGRDLVIALAAKADVLVENFRPSTLQRWRLDYEYLRQVNPRLIYCSISGYGRDTPLADRPGYDFVLQAECGFMAITGEPGGEPMRMGVAFVDVVTGMNAVQAILAALFARERSGIGQSIDIALFDSGLQCLANVGSGFLNTGEEPARHGNAHPSIVPYELFVCADRKRLAIAVGNDEQYQRLCERVLEAPGLWNDDRYKTNRGRTLHRAELVPALQKEVSRHSSDLVLLRMRENGIPVGEVRSVGSALSSAEAAARGAVVSAASDSLGEIRMVQSPLRFSHTSIGAAMPPPMLGEHTVPVLRDVLGLDADAISRLLADETIASGLTEARSTR
jgi:crotonobetainyl-CoA:carnitine CoA-transferase CaiB-like acyl-CoA transferase